MKISFAEAPDMDIIAQAEAYYKDIIDRGVFRNLSSGVFFLSRGRAQHLLGPENTLKSIDFTGSGRGLIRHSPP